MLFSVNNIFWHENESTGYRHVDVLDGTRKLMVVVAHKVADAWEASVVPMGYSFKYSEVQAVSEVFSVLPELMEFLVQDSLSAEQIQEFLLTVQK